MSRFDDAQPTGEERTFFDDVAFGTGEVASEAVSDLVDALESLGTSALSTFGEASSAESLGASGPVEQVGARGTESLAEAPDPVTFGTAPDPDADTVTFGTAPPDESLDDDPGHDPTGGSGL